MNDDRPTLRERWWDFQFLVARFWDTLPGRVLAGAFSAVTLGTMVFVLSSAQNGLLWNHLTPRDFNEWGTVLLTVVAAGYGFYLGVTGQVSD